MFIILFHDTLRHRSTNQSVILQNKCWDYTLLQIYTVPEVWLCKTRPQRFVLALVLFPQRRL